MNTGCYHKRHEGKRGRPLGDLVRRCGTSLDMSKDAALATRLLVRSKINKQITFSWRPQAVVRYRSVRLRQDAQTDSTTKIKRADVRKCRVE